MKYFELARHRSSGKDDARRETAEFLKGARGLPTPTLFLSARYFSALQFLLQKMSTADDYHDSGLRPASTLKSWKAVPAGSDFPIQNVPWGVATFPSDGKNHIVTRIGDSVISMNALVNSASPANAFKGHADLVAAFSKDALNEFMGLGKAKWRAARQIVQDLLKEGASDDAKKLIEESSKDIKDVKMGLPCVIGDYTVSFGFDDVWERAILQRPLVGFRKNEFRALDGFFDWN